MLTLPKFEEDIKNLKLYKLVITNVQLEHKKLFLVQLVGFEEEIKTLTTKSVAPFLKRANTLAKALKTDLVFCTSYDIVKGVWSLSLHQYTFTSEEARKLALSVGNMSYYDLEQNKIIYIGE